MFQNQVIFCPRTFTSDITTINVSWIRENDFIVALATCYIRLEIVAIVFLDENGNDLLCKFKAATLCKEAIGGHKKQDCTLGTNE